MDVSVVKVKQLLKIDVDSVRNLSVMIVSDHVRPVMGIFVPSVL